MRKTLLAATLLLSCSALVVSHNTERVDNDAGYKAMREMKAAPVASVALTIYNQDHYALNDAVVPVVPTKSTKYVSASSDVVTGQLPEISAMARGPTLCSNHLIPFNRDKPV